MTSSAALQLHHFHSLLVILLSGLQHYAPLTFRFLEPEIHLIYSYLSQIHMLAVTVILPWVPSSLCSSLLVTLHLLPSPCPPRSEWLPSDLHLLGDNMQTAVSDFASLILSSVFPLPLHLYPSDAACLFKKHGKYSTATEALDFFFFLQDPVQKGVNYVVKSAEQKLSPLGTAHHLRTQSGAINFCLIFFFFFFLSLLSLNLSR